MKNFLKNTSKNLQNNQKGVEQDKARYAENERNLKMNIETLKEKERNTAEEVITGNSILLILNRMLDLRLKRLNLLIRLPS